MRIFLVQRANARVAHGAPQAATVVAETPTDARVMLGSETSGCARSEWLRGDTVVADVGSANHRARPRVLLMTYASPRVRM